MPDLDCLYGAPVDAGKAVLALDRWVPYGLAIREIDFPRWTKAFARTASYAARLCIEIFLEIKIPSGSSYGPDKWKKKILKDKISVAKIDRLILPPHGTCKLQDIRLEPRPLDSYRGWDRKNRDDIESVDRSRIHESMEMFPLTGEESVDLPADKGRGSSANDKRKYIGGFGELRPLKEASTNIRQSERVHRHDEADSLGTTPLLPCCEEFDYGSKRSPLAELRLNHVGGMQCEPGARKVENFGQRILLIEVADGET